MNEQEILDGLDYINQTLTLHGLPLMTLDQYKESLKYPISDELLPRYPVKEWLKIECAIGNITNQVGSWVILNEH